jgi:predicted secreted protein
MATLKGQNFRVLILNDGKFYVVAMSTNCTITLTNNAEETTTKDDVGLATKQTVTSKSWQVSCESLDVTDAGAMLTAIASMQPFTLMWDETNGTSNHTPVIDASQNVGQAYMNDVTFNFNDREFSTKSLQFQGTGAIEHDSQFTAGDAPAAPVFTKGQFVRLFLSADNTAAPSDVIAAAKSLSLHVSLTLEDATTKDTVGEWQIQEPTALAYDISTSALVRSGETITSQVGAAALADIEAIYKAGTPVKWKIANVSGANNRTASSTIVSGSVILTQLTINGPNRQNATYDAQLTGYGAYTVAA